MDTGSKKRFTAKAKKGHSRGATAGTGLLAQVARIAPFIRLDAVRMTRGSFALIPKGGQKREVPLMVAVNCALSERSLVADVQLDFLDAPAFLEGDGVSIDAAFHVKYSWEPSADLDKRDLFVFGRINGLFNSWPYWREFVQSATLRMELPALVIPLLTAHQAEQWMLEPLKDPQNP